MSTAKVFAFAFNAATVAPQAPMEALPKGWYPVAISDIELVLTGAGNGQRIKTEWTVMDGQMKGRKIFDGFNVANPNPKAQEIGASQFSALCHAVGVIQVTDLRQLLNIPHQILVSLEPERYEINGASADAQGTPYTAATPGVTIYGAKNSFKGVKALGAVAAPGASAAAPGWAVAGAAPAPVAAVPVAGAPRGRGRPPKAQPAPVAPVAPVAVAAALVAERMFWVNLEGPQFANMVGENTLKTWLAQGMPATTELCLDGEEVYKTATAHGVGAAPAAAPVAAVPVAAPAFVPQPVAAAPAFVPGIAPAAAPQVPAWARTV